MNALTCSKLLVVAGSLSLCVGSAQAAICAADQAPAATLLMPYFEVDLDACGTPSASHTTTFWVRNVSQTPQLSQVTLWTDAGIAAAGFHIYLPPFAARRVDLADVLCRGVLPSTGAGVMPVSEFGAATSNVNFPGCNGGPSGEDGVPVANQFSPQFLAEVQLRLTGKRTPSSGNGCWGLEHGDLVARGYLTIDDVEACGLFLPTDPGYQSVIGFDNALVGGFQWVDLENNFAQGGAAVAIEAAEPGEFVPGDRTFYGRYTNFFASDRREPLPGSWAASLREGGVTADTTDVVVWRDTPRMNPSSQLCNRFNQFLPLGATDQRLFDDSGESEPAPIVFPGQTPPTPTPIGYATQRLRSFDVEDTSSAALFSIGSMAYVNLFTVVPGMPPPFLGQGWVGSIVSSEGRFSDLSPGAAMDSSCNVGHATTADVSGPRAENLNTRDYLFQDGFD